MDQSNEGLLFPRPGFLGVDDHYQSVTNKLQQVDAMLKAIDWGLEKVSAKQYTPLLNTLFTLSNAAKWSITEALWMMEDWYKQQEEAYKVAEDQVEPPPPTE